MHPVTIAVLAAIPPTLAAIVALIIGLRNGKKVSEVHVLVNSQMTAALERVQALEEKLGLSAGEAIPGAQVVAVPTTPEPGATS